MRSHAQFYGGPCRAEASRIRRILNSAAPDGYRSLGDRLEAARKRTRCSS